MISAWNTANHALPSLILKVRGCFAREVKAAHLETKKAAIAGHASYNKSPDAMALTTVLTGLVSSLNPLNRSWSEGQDKNYQGDPADDFSFSVEFYPGINNWGVPVAEKDHYNSP